MSMSNAGSSGLPVKAVGWLQASWISAVLIGLERQQGKTSASEFYIQGDWIGYDIKLSHANTPLAQR